MWVYVPEKRYAINIGICHELRVYEDDEKKYRLAVDYIPESMFELVLHKGTEEECMKYLNEIIKAMAMNTEVYVLRSR